MGHRWLDYYRPELDLHIERGVVPGVTHLLKFGNLEVTSAAWQAVWPIGGLYPFAQAAEVVELVSDNAADTAAGLGAQSVAVVGLDENWLDQTEIVVMNGLTPVQTVNTWQRVFRMAVLTCGVYDGSTAANQGVITCDGVTTGDTYAVIRPNEGQTRQCIWTVPANQHAYLIRFFVSAASNKDTEFRLMFRDDADVQTGTSFTSPRSAGNLYGINGPVQIETPNVVVSPKTDIWFECRSAIGTTPSQAQLDFRVIDDTHPGHGE